MRAIVIKLVAAVFSIGLLAVAGQAAAGCNHGCAPPPPPTPPHNPPPPNNCHSCGGGGGKVDVNVNVNVKANASASGSAGANATVYGGGYGNWSQTPGYPQQVGGLAVVTGDEGMYETYSESRSFTRRTVIRASCIDDTGVPHPASQVSGNRDVDNGYMGELYRCIAGTHMELTMADFGDCDVGAVRGSYEEQSSMSSSSSSSYSRGGSRNGRAYQSQGGSSMSSDSSESSSSYGSRSAACSADFSHINFDGGKTMTCQKGEALWFDRGNLSCKAQIPARQCNERSLLRRFGVGMKVLTVTRNESITKRREVMAASKSSYTSTMTFDGGVGGFVQ